MRLCRDISSRFPAILSLNDDSLSKYRHLGIVRLTRRHYLCNINNRLAIFMRFAARQKRKDRSRCSPFSLYPLPLSSQNHFPSNEADRCFCAPSLPTIAEAKGMQNRMRCKADGEDETAAALAAVRISTSHPTKQVAFSAPRHSHSMVAGGFDDTSYTTRLTPLTLFIISFESRASTS